jgi:hypothetical protein
MLEQEDQQQITWKFVSVVCKEIQIKMLATTCCNDKFKIILQFLINTTVGNKKRLGVSQLAVTLSQCKEIQNG